MPAPLIMDSIAAAVDHVLDTVPGDIVLGIPLAIGKPNPFVNALYRRIKANPARRLRIITALSLEKPVGNSELEQHFLAPLVARVFGDYPDLDYVKDLRAHQLPPNVEVSEFFMKAGVFLDNPIEQQNYISSNYTHIARDMLANGVNVLAQLVARKVIDGRTFLSLSCNPDVSPTIVPVLRQMEAQQGYKVAVIAEVNNNLPFMYHDAMVPDSTFDMVIDNPAYDYTLFSTPNMTDITALPSQFDEALRIPRSMGPT